MYNYFIFWVTSFNFWEKTSNSVFIFSTLSNVLLLGGLTVLFSPLRRYPKTLPKLAVTTSGKSKYKKCKLSVTEFFSKRAMVFT